MGKGRTGNALPTELLPRLVEQIGFEPMTDNPMSSAHHNESGQGAKVNIDCCSIRLSYFRRSGRADLNRQPTVPVTHHLRPAKITTDKKRTGNLRALPLSYPGIWSRRPDSNRRPRVYER